ncbi:FG-GAP repeat domain-containing protein [Sorangium sp. So ce381]|uniref:FG-GAP repeat domain-containing protein n=1 Tax=Sorangium sp. So ce381 TaxID=3133307 RepID=UPI003F5BFB49
MTSPVVVTKYLCAAAAIHAVLGCAAGVDLPDEGGSAPPATPTLGVAEQRASAYGWRIIQTLDFNFDGKQDVLWIDPDRSRMAIWYMDGVQLLTPGPILYGPAGRGWIAIANDFNVDGMGDVIWRHDQRDLITIWYMDGGRPFAQGPMIPGPRGSGWVIRPNDFNRNLGSDVLFYNEEKNLMTVWLMDGSQLLAPGPFISGPGTDWDIGPVPDFNFDRIADVVWNDDVHNLMTVWLMSNTEVLGRGPVIPGPIGEGWEVLWASDFNADGMADVLWSNGDKGLVAVWLMNGVELLDAGPVIPGPIGDGWRAIAAGDVNGDLMTDVVWQRLGTSQMAVWLMNGTHLLSPGPVILGPPGG